MELKAYIRQKDRTRLPCVFNEEIPFGEFYLKPVLVLSDGRKILSKGQVPGQIVLPHGTPQNWLNRVCYWYGPVEVESLPPLNTPGWNGNSDEEGAANEQ